MTPARRRTFDYSKRVFDIMTSAAALIVLAPVMAVVAGLVAVRLGRPVVFRQMRPGLGGAPFVLLKFRTMHLVDDARGVVTNEQRMTGLGRILRAWSLDELPSLWNILRGDMSVIGPRPLLMEYLPLYSPEQARRHNVRPGLTGLAQVSGRNALDWSTRLELDVRYVRTRSWALDARILVSTVSRVVRREGIVSAGNVVGARFVGTPAGEAESA